MPDYSNLSVLIIDPNQGMRASLHNMLTQMEVSRIDHAVSAGTAIRQLGRKSYDVILCEYNLSSGGNEHGQDGQQLLEDLRHHAVIGQWTIFIMLTSEGAYGKVVSAAELTPTDYILKPLTVDVLSQRVTRAVERRAIFLPIYQLIGQGNLRDALARCRDGEVRHTRLAADFGRLRAELHVSLGELAEAEQLYGAIAAERALGWAQLGQAECQLRQGRVADARASLTALLAHSPKLMAAYDLLAQAHERLGERELAKATLEQAVTISPHMVRRLRKLGEAALATGDAAAAEKAFRQVVARSKYSEFRDPEDHVRLVESLTRKGDANGASGAIRELERSLRGAANLEACRAYASALLQQLHGNDDGAVAELSKACAAVANSEGLSAALKSGLVLGCLRQAMTDQAGQLLATWAGDPASGIDAAQAAALCVQGGHPALLDELAAREDRDVEAQVAAAAALSGAGDRAGAVHVLTRALAQRPHNPGLLSTLATALLHQIAETGWDADHGQQCAGLLVRMRGLPGGHPLLASLSAQFAAARKAHLGAPRVADAANLSTPSA